MGRKSKKSSSPKKQQQVEESPEPVNRNKTKQNDSPKKRNNSPKKKSRKNTSSPQKQKTKSSKNMYGAQHGNSDFLKENWKIIALAVLFLGVMTFTKMAEETFGRYNVRSSNQVEEDLYELVGASKSSTFEEIKSSYKKKALDLHPDRNPDCKDCQEKFAKVSKAYEVLMQPESRRYYDKTNAILKVIKSTSVTLNSDNFQQLVEESSDIWIIMVYLDTDEISRTYTGFFDEVSQRYPFVKFGRVNYASEQSLIARLPFKVEEIPFFMTWDKFGNSDFLEFDLERGGKTPILKFVRQALGKHYRLPGIKKISKEISSTTSSRPSVTFVNRSWMPTSYSYLAYKFDSYMNVWSTVFGEHKQIYKQVGQKNIDYVITLPETLKHNDKSYFTLKFESASSKNEATHLNVFTLVKFLVIPDLGRGAFNEFCNGGNQEDDTGKFTVCILALKNGGSSQIEDTIKTFVEEQNNLLPKFVEKVQNVEGELFESAKTLQFGIIDLKKNKAIGNIINNKVKVKNPKIMIYISGQKKVSFFNNIDDALDVIEDIKAGEIDGFKHWKVVSDSEEPIAKFLVPDNIGFFTVLFRSVKKQFFSFFNIILAGVVIYCGQNYGGSDYQTSAIAVSVVYFLIALITTFSECNRIGIF